MRVEDLDGPRTRREAVLGNLAELRWLGLDWDEGPDAGGKHAPYVQSARGGAYAAAFERLSAAGRLFPCYLSRKDLAEAASAPHGAPSGTPLQARHSGAPRPGAPGEGVPGPVGENVYGEAERAMSAAAAQAKAAAGASPSWRFAVTDEEVEFLDACAGPVRLDLRRDVGHFVVRRSDGLWAYQLAVVVDDAAMGITEVVRGADLLASTGAQLALYGALGLRPPTFAHVGLLTDAGGERLAKRRGSLTLQELELAGVRPERVLGLLAATIGVLPAPAELDIGELRASFEPERHGCAGARLSPLWLDWLLERSADR